MVEYVQRITIDASGARRGANEAEQAMRRVERSGDSASGSFERLRDRTTGTGSAFEELRDKSMGVGGELDRVREVALRASGALAGIGAAGAGIGLIARQASQTAREVTTLSQLANTSSQQFQRWAYASETVGVQQDKLADILKDTNDRVGEFLQTGSGEMEEFFTRIAPKVGVTADEFRRLSGPEALQLYYSSLQEAGLSQQEMTFYMESMADEATALIPLLRDGGQGFSELAGEAARLNIELSDLELERLTALRGEFSQFETTVSVATAKAVSDFGDELSGALEALGEGAMFLSDNMEEIISFGKVAAALYAGKLASALWASHGAAFSLTGALTAVRSVSMSLFGPAGIVLAGVTALGEIGRAFDNSAEKAKEMEFRANELAESLQHMGETSIRTQLAAITLELAQMDGAQEALEAQNQRNINSTSVLGAEFGNLHEQIQTTVVAQRHGREEHEKMRTQQMALEQALKLVTESGETTTRTIEEYAGSTSEASESTDTFASDLESLRRQLDPAYAAQRKLASSTALLDRGLATGALTLEQYLGLWDRAAETFIEAGDETERLAETSDVTASDMARAWEEASNRIDETFADAFQGAFDSFDDFADQLLDGFKRLLAELAYQATLRPIVVGFTADMQRSMGMTPQSNATLSGGMGDLLSTGKSLFGGNSIGQGFYNVGSMLPGGTAAAAGGGLYGQIGGQVQTGGMFSNAASMPNWAYGLAGIGGGLLGGALFDGEYSSLGGSLGATGGMALGSSMSVLGSFGGPIGAVVGSVLGGALGSVFGSERDLDLAMRRTSSPGQEDWDKGIVAEGALGAVGFRRDGSDQIDKLWDVDQAKQLVAGIAQLDTALASLTDNSDELEAMRAAVLAPDRHGVQGHYGETSDPGKVVSRLTSRYKNAIDALDSAFESTLLGFDGGAEELVTLAGNLDAVETAIGGNADAMAEAQRQLSDSGADVLETAQRLAQQASALAMLDSATERLNLRFDATAEGALVAADSLAQMAGGLDNLAALQSSYYQAYFSDAERAAHLQDDLTQAMREMGMQLPDTRAEFRALVEAQDLSTTAGRETYVELLRLAGGFDQLRQSIGGVSDTMGGVRSAWDDLTAAVNAERDILREAHQQTTQSIRDNMRTVQDAMRDTERVARGLQSALDTMMGNSVIDQRGRFSTASDYLRSVLASGGLGDAGELERALAVVADPSQDTYETLEDYKRDFLRTAYVVDKLHDRADEQLTTEERSLRALEQQLTQADRQFEREMQRLDDLLTSEAEQLEAAHGQLDWLSTVNDSVLSVMDAINALEFATEQASSGSGGATADAINRAYRDILGRDADESGLAYYAGSGFSLSEIRARLRDSDEANPNRVPGFASGGIHMGGARIVGERGPELEVTGPSRIYSADQTRNLLDQTELIAEVREMNRRLDRLEGYARVSSDNAAKIGNVIRRWRESGVPQEA